MIEEKWCDWSDCVECPLALWRKRPVCARGAGKRKVIFIGEAPGEQEEVRGFAFVGRSGELLDVWIRELELEEKDVYITNVVKCRPPQNRTPTPFEIQECLHWLEEELRALEPKLVIPLGNTAQSVIGELRQLGLVNDENYGLKVKHPAWYLRQGYMGSIPTAEIKFLRRKLDAI